MNHVSRFPLFRFLPIGTAALALLGCQQESTNPPEAASGREYALEVQNLKAGNPEEYDAGLSALNARFGFAAPVPGSAATASGEEGEALEKAAVTKVVSTVGKCVGVPKGIFSVSAGDVMHLYAKAFNTADGPADPMLYLIQFNNPAFKANGEISTTAQSAFKILAWNDDVVPGNLSSGIDYTFKTGESGYFMWLAVPYANANATGVIGLSIDFEKASCPNCDYVIKNPIRANGGMLFKGLEGDDFRAGRTGNPYTGDPHLYIFLNSTATGIANPNSSTLTLNARISPFALTPALATPKGNVILVDNDLAGSGTFAYTQYKN